MPDSQPATASRAVFLSYASQDATAAREICEALRRGGVEVWFDADGGLEHGDEWDAKIRRQIRDCVLFIPIISASTQAREEGYFRIEWELAARRAFGIASGVPFILPVVIDDTREPEALVPDPFRAVQWMRLRDGQVPPEALARFLKLWSHRAGRVRTDETRAAVPNTGNLSSPAAPRDAPRQPVSRKIALAGVALLVLAAGVGWWWIHGRPKPDAPAGLAQTASDEPQPLIPRARALYEALDSSREDFKLAEELLAQAKTKEPMDAEVWAAEAQLDNRYLARGWDVSDARREAARVAAQRAVRLDPKSFEARLAKIGLLPDTGPEGAEKERLLRALRLERPTDKRVLRWLAGVLDRSDRMDESAAIADEAAALPGGDPLSLYDKSLGFWFRGRTSEAEGAVQASLAQQPFAGALLIAAWYRVTLHGDLDGARGFVARINGEELEDRAAYIGFYIELLARRPDAALARLAAVPRDWLNDFWYRGPKGLLAGVALEIGGRHDAAAVEWTTALKLVDQRLMANANDVTLIHNRIQLLARLGRRAEAERQFSLVLQMIGAEPPDDADAPDWVAKIDALLGHNAVAMRRISAGLQSVKHAVGFPSGELRLDPVYDALRGEPEFAQIIAHAQALERGGAPGVTRHAETPAGLPAASPTST